jgi:hydroxymethylglutaryl-CoA synthase
MKIGIVGYGVYIPRERIKSTEIAKFRESKRKDLEDFLKKIKDGLLLEYKSIASLSEDTITMATEASENAIKMAGIDPKKIGSVVAGSESKPYAVGTIARHVASFVGAGENVYVADLEGACNAGMQGVSFLYSEVKSGRIDYGLAIGSDIAQAPIGDPLEYSAGAGACAFIIGKEDLVATIEDIVPYSTLTMDFWRREESFVPRHFGKTTVDAYMKHVIGAIETLLQKHKDIALKDFDHITFHQPSGYVPLKTCRTLTQPNIEFLNDKSIEDRIRLTQEDIEKKVKPWLRVLDTGNTYAASTMIAIASILDKASPGDNVLAVPYGSGAYSLAVWIKVEENILKKREKTPKVDDYVSRKFEINFKKYESYLKERLKKNKKKLNMEKIVGEITPLSSENFEVSLCDGCKRIYYPSRNKCLEYECPNKLLIKTFPRLAKLNSFKKLSLKNKITNYDIMSQEKVLLVDCDFNELKKDMEVEAVIRRLDYEGHDGLIIYAPCYRPLFRK